MCVLIKYSNYLKICFLFISIVRGVARARGGLRQAAVRAAEVRGPLPLSVGHTLGGALAVQSVSGHARARLYSRPIWRLHRYPYTHIASSEYNITAAHIYKLLRPLTIAHSPAPRPASNLTRDCLFELSVRVLCCSDNITCMTSRAQAT